MDNSGCYLAIYFAVVKSLGVFGMSNQSGQKDKSLAESHHENVLLYQQLLKLSEITEQNKKELKKLKELYTLLQEIEDSESHFSYIAPRPQAQISHNIYAIRQAIEETQQLIEEKEVTLAEDDGEKKEKLMKTLHDKMQPHITELFDYNPVKEIK